MAGVSVPGDWARLHRLVSGLKRLADPAVMRTANGQMAEVAVSFIQESFATGRTPHGAPWKPLKYREGQPLRDTGRLMGSIDRHHDERGFVLFTPVIYAAVHNYGYPPRNIPRRQFVPDIKRMPRKWRAAFVDVLADIRKQHLGR